MLQAPSAEAVVLIKEDRLADEGEELARWAGGLATEAMAADGRFEDLRTRTDVLAALCLAELDPPVAGELLRPHRGKPEADLVLARLAAAGGLLDEALELLRPHCAEHYSPGTRLRADLLAAAGRSEDLARLAARGDDHAAGHLVGVLAGTGRAGEAVEFVRRRRDAGKERFLAAWAVADRAEVESLRAAAAMGHWLDIGRLRELLDRRRAVDDALAVADDPIGRALLLALRGRLGEAVRVLRDGAHPDHLAARPLLKVLNGEKEHFEDLVYDARTGASGIAGIAALLAEQGRRDEAVAVLSWAAGAGHRRAAHQLIELLA
jgi:hypothetical protein